MCFQTLNEQFPLYIPPHLVPFGTRTLYTDAVKMLYKHGYVGKQKHLFVRESKTCQSQSEKPICWEESSFYLLSFSEVFIRASFASVSCLSSSLSHFDFHNMLAPSVFFHLVLCDSFQLSFYLLREGRNSFLYFSLFPEPDAQSVAWRRCF